MHDHTDLVELNVLLSWLMQPTTDPSKLRRSRASTLGSLPLPAGADGAAGPAGCVSLLSGSPGAVAAEHRSHCLQRWVPLAQLHCSAKCADVQIRRMRRCRVVSNLFVSLALGYFKDLRDAAARSSAGTAAANASPLTSRRGSGTSSDPARMTSFGAGSSLATLRSLSLLCKE